MLAERLRHDDSVMLEYPVKDGNWHLVRFIVQTRGENGEAEQVLFAMRLYSEEKRREKDLMSAADAARRANEAKSEFLSRMSHDIRTPMNVIMGFTNIALQHADDSDKMKECLEKIRVSGSNLQELIDDVPDISRIESGEFKIVSQPVKLPELFDFYCQAIAGIGMTPEFMEQMYSAFSRAVDTRVNKVRGSGLGLAIVKKIVDLMGGAIEAESKVGKGTTFRVTLDLPAAADDAESDTVTTHFEYHSMESNLLKLDMLGHDDPTMIRMLEDLTGVNARTDIPLDDPDTMSIFQSSKVLGYEDDKILGPTGAVAIPEFNTRFTRQMLIDTQPKDFNTLVRLSGFSHGTDVWMGNARELILSGTASVLETVGCRDDIMLYLISKGLDPKMSFKIMEKVRKGKVKKGGFDEGWEEAMMEHDVPDWYIESLAKIGYLFPKAHAVAYVMMAFRIAWFKVHEPLAFYATFFSVRAKAFDAEYCCAGMDAVKRKIKEIENNKDATAVEQNLLTTLEVCYEFYLRGFHFDTINIYKSDATKFIVTEKGLLPPFVTVHGLGEAAALDTVEKRKGKEFISIEEFAMCCNKLSKTHIEQLKALALDVYLQTDAEARRIATELMLK